MKNRLTSPKTLTRTINVQSPLKERFTYRQGVVLGFPKELPDLRGTHYVPDTFPPIEILMTLFSFAAAYPVLDE